MATYTYDDTYIVNSIDDTELTQVEADALLDLEKQGVTDPYYVEQLCKCLVYITLSGRQLESEGFQEKADHYNKEYLRFSKMNTHGNTDKGTFSATIGRA